MYTHHVIKHAGDEKVVLLKSPDRINFIFQRKIWGISENGKPWSRWDDVTELSFSTRRAGRLNVYKKEKVKISKDGRKQKVRVFRNVSPRLFEWYIGIDEHVIANAVSELVGRKFTSRREIYHYIYPIAGALGEFDFPKGRGRYWRQEDYIKFMRREFGRGYRKDVAKALATKRMSGSLKLSKTLLNAGVPGDWVVEMINNLDHAPHTTRLPAYGALKGLIFAHMSPRQLKKLVVGDGGNLGLYAEDIVRSHVSIQMAGSEFDFRGYTTWRDLDRGIARAVRAVKEKNLPIPETNISKIINEIDHEEYTFIPARETDDLRNWGDKMHNCIGSYRGSALGGKVILVGVYKGDLLANLEITPDGDLRQILGKFNNSLPKGDQRAIVDVLVEAGAVKKYAQAWGVTLELAN